MVTRQCPRGYFFEGQFAHLLLLIGLVAGALYLAEPALGDGAWLGMSDTAWFTTMLVVVVAHQVYVWFGARAQLCYGLFTRLFGRHDMAVWGAIFLPLLALRVVTLGGLALADAGSLGGPRWLQLTLGGLLLIPAAYTGYSVARYFGVRRALMADHFRAEYRAMPLVDEGIFRYSSNAMYTYGFLVLWSIALLAGSRAALAGALFQHAYIWVHWYTVEQPDMRLIYSR